MAFEAEAPSRVDPDSVAPFEGESTLVVGGTVTPPMAPILHGVDQALPVWSFPVQSDAAVTWLMAALPDSKAMVLVGPPLLAKPVGLSPAGVSDSE